jgi:esterase/lipase superfamily enzyme
VQADLAKPGSAATLVDSLVLISPDISPDVFLSQVAQISRLPSPLIVFTSSEDRALRLSKLVAADNVRLGKPSTDPRLDATGAIFLDVTAFNARANKEVAREIWTGALSGGAARDRQEAC